MFNDQKVISGFSERKDGTMLFALNNREQGFENQCSYFKILGLQSEYNFVRPFICHGNRVEIVNKDNFFDDKVIRNTDGFVTKDKKIVLTVTAADCLPVYFYDEVAGVIGLAHAGWRGVVGEIVINTVKKMQELGSKPENIKVFVGPHLQKHHFNFKADILNNFLKYKDLVEVVDAKNYQIALGEIVQRQLESAGVQKENIKISSECTFCNSEKYFSYRRDKSNPVEVMVGWVVLK